jgi:DNA-binding MarR family transcriptional regulator
MLAAGGAMTEGGCAGDSEGQGRRAPPAAGSRPVVVELSTSRPMRYHESMPSDLVARPSASSAAPTARAASDPARALPGESELGAWRTFLQAHARLTHRLDEELRAAHGLSLAEYEALLHIAQAPGRRLRMSALADRVLLSRSGITRLVDRLVADGTAERSACPTDARGAEAALTAEGLTRLRAAAVTHLGGIERYFLAPVDRTDLDAMERAFQHVIDAVGPSVAPDDLACGPESP